MLARVNQTCDAYHLGAHEMIDGQVSFFEPLPREVTKEWYGERAMHQLPTDVLNACDEVRRQKKEIGQLRHDLLEAQKVTKVLGIEKRLLLTLLGSIGASGLTSALVWYLAELLKHLR